MATLDHIVLQSFLSAILSFPSVLSFRPFPSCPSFHMAGLLLSVSKELGRKRSLQAIRGDNLWPSLLINHASANMKF